MHGGGISLRTRSGKTRANRPASSQGLPEGGTITTPPYNAPMVGGAFPVAANLAPVREVPLRADQPSVRTQQSIGRNDPVQFDQGLAADCLGFPREQCSLGVGELSPKDQILGADRAGGTQERDARPQDVRDDSDDCSRQLQHALIMPDSACVCGCPTRKCRRRELLRATAESIGAVPAESAAAYCSKSRHTSCGKAFVVIQDATKSRVATDSLILTTNS